jgi:hypothetical protein
MFYSRYQIPAELKEANITYLFDNIYVDLLSLEIDKDFKDELIETFQDYRKNLSYAYEFNTEYLRAINFNQFLLKKLQHDCIQYQNSITDINKQSIEKDFEEFIKSLDFCKKFGKQNFKHNLRDSVSLLSFNTKFYMHDYNKNLNDLKKYKRRYKVFGTTFSALSCALGCSLAGFVELFNGCIALAKSNRCTNPIVVVCFATVIVSLIAYFGLGFYVSWQKNSNKNILNKLNKFFEWVNWFKMSQADYFEQVKCIENKTEILLNKVEDVHTDIFVNGMPLNIENDFIEELNDQTNELFDEIMKMLTFLNNTFRHENTECNGK